MLKRSEKYDPAMVRKCMAGPNALYLTDELTQSMHLEAGMQILDLGCGRGLSSVFLAKEYGVCVYSVDPKVYASETYQMVKDLGLDKQIFPIQAEAGSLPIPPATMDALVCINSYHNFGMEAGFFERYLKPVLRKGAEVGIVVPGMNDAVGSTDKTDTQNPVFWTALQWKEWFESEGIEVHSCEQMTCASKAWKEWMNVMAGDLTSPIANSVRMNDELTMFKITGFVKEGTSAYIRSDIMG